MERDLGARTLDRNLLSEDSGPDPGSDFDPIVSFDQKAERIFIAYSCLTI